MGRHGGGSRSGGGGGGFSFSSSHHHHGGSSFGHHHHHHSGGGAVIWIGGTVRSRPRVCCSCILVTLVIVAIIVIASVAPKNSSTQLQLTALETALINPSTSWYSTVIVETGSSEFIQTLKFAQIPPFGTGFSNRTESQQLNTGVDDYEFYAYNLLEGSIVNLSFQLSGNMNFYVIQGDSDFSKWKDGNDVTYLKSLFTNSLSGYQLQIPSSDSYYFVWENHVSNGQVTGNAMFNIRSRTYNLNNYLESCSQATCSMSLSTGSSQVIIVAAADSHIPNDVFQVNYSLVSRGTYYWAIFGSVIGVVLCCVITAIVVMAIHYKRSLSSSYSDPSILNPPPTTSLLAPSTPPYVTLENQPLMQPQPTFYQPPLPPTTTIPTPTPVVYGSPVPPPQYPPSAPPFN